ncbi:hypothetical protein F4805DRAFT_242137 [Annulohypoxylon moriforme]|nr:hypothetical protein F4805DRAFT_242137 [Annulohypoxylon moriforme]
MAFRARRPLRPSKDPNGKNIHHCQPPRYAPFGHFQDPTLYNNAYKPRDLLNYVVAAFYDRSGPQMNDKQVEAGIAFVCQFGERKGAYGKEVDPIGSLRGLQNEIKEFFSYIDDFFFFGLLKDHVQFNTGFDLVGNADGWTSWWIENGRAHTQVDLNIGTGGRLYNLRYIVEWLIFEMVCAYLFAFGCDCDKCFRDTLNTVGHYDDGHGPIFLMLHRLVLTEIRRWGTMCGEGDLRTLEAVDCPGQSMSIYGRGLNSAAIDRLGMARLRFNPIRGQKNPNHLIRFSASGEEVIVAARLKDRQIEMENALRFRWERGMRHEADYHPVKGRPMWEWDMDDSPPDSDDYEEEEDDDETTIQLEYGISDISDMSSPGPPMKSEGTFIKLAKDG